MLKSQPDPPNRAVPYLFRSRKPRWFFGRAGTALRVVFFVGLIAVAKLALGGDADEAKAPRQTNTTVLTTDFVTPPVMTLAAGTQLTEQQQRAAAVASKWLNEHPISRKRMIEQLSQPNDYSDTFSVRDATVAVDSLDVNWSDQAAKSAQIGIDMFHTSRSKLIDSLKLEGFTTEQAAVGVDSLNLDWVEQAALAGQSLVETSTASQNRVINWLQYDGFTVEQATAGVKRLNVDWGAEARDFVADRVKSEGVSRAELLRDTTNPNWGGFTEIQASAAIDGLDVDWKAEAVQSLQKRVSWDPLAKEWTCTETLTALTDGNTGTVGKFTDEQALYAAKELKRC